MTAPGKSYGDVERVREATDLVAVIGQHVALTPAGENLKGLCPFHTDTKPSFTVSPAKQLYYCFGCGEGGDVFHFVMKLEGLAFDEALRELASRAGIALRARGRATPRERRRERLVAILASAEKFFYDNLRAQNRFAEGARRYLLGRGVTAETMDEWRLGLAPDAWDGFLKRATQAGYRPAEVAEAGLVVPSKSGRGYYDRFRGRIIFPIWNASGTVVAFGGRLLDDGEPKYLNSSNTPLYSKSATLYGLYQNRGAIARARKCLLVEGYLDLVGLRQAGFDNVVATCGTALAEEAATVLARHASEFVLLFDGDEAGLRASRRAIAALLAPGAGRVRVGLLPADRDPFDVAREGREAVEAVVEAARDWPDFIMEVARRRHGRDGAGMQLAVIDEARELLAAIPDEMVKKQWQGVVAKMLGFSIDVLPVRPSRAVRAPPRPAAEQNLLRILVQHPAAANECLAEISPEEVEDEQVRRVLRVMAKLARRGPFSIVELLDELEEADAGAITRLAMAEVKEEDASRAARLAVKALRRRTFARRAREVRERIAARGGDYEEAASAIRELVEEKKRRLASDQES